MMEVDAIVQAVNETNTILREYSTIEQHMQQLELFLGFMVVQMMIILFIAIRRRGHKKIMWGDTYGRSIISYW